MVEVPVEKVVVQERIVEVPVERIVTQYKEVRFPQSPALLSCNQCS